MGVDIQVCLCPLYIYLCWRWQSLQNLTEVFRSCCVLLGFCDEQSPLLVHHRSISANYISDTQQPDDLIDFALLSPTCCIFCLAWWVVYVALLLCSCHHLHCSVRFHPLLLVSLLQSL